MARPLVSAADIRDARSGEFVVPTGAIVTPLARDLARDRGIRLVEQGVNPSASRSSRSSGSSGSSETEDLESQVRRLVAAMLAGDGSSRAGPGRPVKSVDHRSVVLEPFGFPGPGPDQQVRATDVVTSQDGSPVAAGYMSLTAGEFPWTLTYDEVQVVLEGELHIGTQTGTKVGRPGDVLYVPKGSAITFGTPSWAKFVYVTFPADWAG